jgi:hypothetical protein
MPSPAPPPAGLCERCAHARLVRTPRSAFWLCGRARDDARFQRYPRIPVLECPGFETLPDGETPPEGPPGRGSQG